MGDAGKERTVNGHGPAAKMNGESTNFNVKTGLAKMLKGGVIMDVVNAEQVNSSYVDKRQKLTCFRPALLKKQVLVR